MHIPHHTLAENLSNNVIRNNSAAYEIYISTMCRPDLNPSLGSSRCIHCKQNWRRDLIGTVVAAFIAGIALVILMLALNVNMTVAVGTLNGILFYVHKMQTLTFGHSQFLILSLFSYRVLILILALMFAF